MTPHEIAEKVLELKKCILYSGKAAVTSNERRINIMADFSIRLARAVLAMEKEIKALKEKAKGETP